MVIDDAELRSIVKVQKETRSGQYICDCPYCGKPMHFYINKKTQLFDCKKCGEVGSIYKLLKHFNKLYLLGGKKVENTITIKSIRQIQEVAENKTEIKELPIKQMPIGWKVMKQPNDYLVSRHITESDCKKYQIGSTSLVSKYQNYILIPITDEGKIRGYIGRYGSKRVPENKLRYNNSLGTDFASLLFGYDDIIKDKTETVIITEGVFDKFAVDRYLQLYADESVRCICTFGKKISDIQIQKLVNKNISNVILAYDFDAIKEIKQYGMELNYYFNTSVAVSCKKKDIDECTKEEAIEVFYNITPIKKFCASVIGKIKR